MNKATTELNLQGKYVRIAGAPRGLRAIAQAGEIDRMLESVSGWRRAELEIASHREGLVAELRRRGGSWDTVGWVLSTTGEAARQRYGDSGG